MISQELHTLFVFKAAAAKVNDFDGTLSWVLQENVLYVMSDENCRQGISKHASGFKSQWTILWWRIKHKDMIIWLVNLRINVVVKPTKPFALINSYKLMLSSSIAIQR